MPRQGFTKDEDQLLVKYLATYTPTLNGRRGNKVFETLVENLGRRWPWAAAHSWQSWRNRYVKDQEVFDDMIRRYQRKKQIHKADENDSTAQERQTVMQRVDQRFHNPRLPRPTVRDVYEEDLNEANQVASDIIQQTDDTPELEGKYSVKQEGEDDAAERKFAESKPKPNAPPGPSVTAEPVQERKLEPIHHKLEPEPESEPEPVANSRPHVPLKKRKRVPGSDSDVFGSFSPSPHLPSMSPLPVSRTARPPPRVVNGHFSTSLADSKGKARATRMTSDSESDTAIPRRRRPPPDPWPPRRHRGHSAHTTVQKQPVADPRSTEAPTKVDQEVQTSDTPTEPTPKRPRTAASKTVRIASVPVETIPPPPLHHHQPDEDEPDHHHPFSQPSQYPAYPDEDLGHHPFSQPSYNPFSSPVQHSSHHPFSQPTQTWDDAVGTSEAPQATLPPILKVGAGNLHSQHSLAGEQVVTPPRRISPSVSHETDEIAKFRLERGANNAFSSKYPGDTHNSHAASVDDPFLDDSSVPEAAPKRAEASSLMVVLNQSTTRKSFAGFSPRVVDPSTTLDDLPAPRGRSSLPRSNRVSPERPAVPFTTSTPPTSDRTSIATDTTVSNTRMLPLSDVDLASVIREMSLNHGFQEHVTWRLYKHFGNLRTVDTTLKGMREVGEEFAAQVYEQRVAELGQQSVEHVHITRSLLDASEPDRDSPSSKTMTSTHTTRSSRSHRSSFAPTKTDRSSRSGQFNPVLVDDIPDLDYTPPEGSRAARILEHTRREGAMSISPVKVAPVVNLDTPGLPQLSDVSGRRRAAKSIERLRLHDPAKEAEKETGWEWNKNSATQSKEDEESERNLGTHTIRQRTMQMLTALGII